MILTHTIVNPQYEKYLKELTGNMDVTFNSPENLMEVAARSCYDSLGKYQSAPNFIKQIVKQEHMDILEHGYLAYQFDLRDDDWQYVNYFIWVFKNKYPYARVDVESVFRYNETRLVINIAANFRVWFEMQADSYDDLYGYVTDCDLYYLRYYLNRLAPSIFVQNGDEFWSVDKREFKCFFPSAESTVFGNEINLLAYAPPHDSYSHYTFQMKDVSRALMAQHTRHRRFVHSVKSSRYVDARNSLYVHNPETSPEQRALIDAHFLMTVNLYEQLRVSGMKKEDARGIMPTNMATDVITSGDMAAWLWYFHERVASDAQDEIRNCAILIKRMHDRVQLDI